MIMCDDDDDGPAALKNGISVFVRCEMSHKTLAVRLSILLHDVVEST